MPRAHDDRDSLVREWTVALVLGELVGFLPPALAGAALAAAGAGDVLLVAGLTVAGTGEGLVLGAFGARVLARHAPRVDGRAWTIGTGVAAGVAWLAGMGGAALLGGGDLPAWTVGVVVAGMVVALFGMGVAQWLVLRRARAGTGSWVWASAGAWLVGVAIPVAALSVVPDGWPAFAHAAVGVVAAVAMGATVGLLTGRTLRRLLRGDAASGQSTTPSSSQVRGTTVTRSSNAATSSAPPRRSRSRVV